MRLPLAVALAFALMATGGPTAGADESRPNCEPGQRHVIPGAPIHACEGEQWDGQDPSGPSALGAGVGSGPAPTVSDPVHASAFADPFAAFAHLGVFGLGETSLYVNGTSRTIAVWLRDGTDVLVRGTEVHTQMADVDRRLGRGNPGADGNLLAWTVSWPFRLLPLGMWGGPAGEGDCDQATYAMGGCTRDNTAVTVSVPPIGPLP